MHLVLFSLTLRDTAFGLGRGLQSPSAVFHAYQVTNYAIKPPTYIQLLVWRLENPLVTQKLRVERYFSLHYSRPEAPHQSKQL